MAANITDEKKQEIVSCYLRGLTGREVAVECGVAYSTVWMYTKGMRSSREARLLSFQRGRIKLSDDGRKRLSEAGKNAVKRMRKFWTDPERKFMDLLREEGILVGVPNFIVDLFDIRSDDSPEVYFQYPVECYTCDFVDVERKVVFRINGDYWHANPALYSEELLTKPQKFNVQQDKKCKKFLEKRGWFVCDIWQSEIEWNRELVIDKIRAAREQGNPPLLQRGIDRIVTDAALQEWNERLVSLWFRKPKMRSHTTKEKTEIPCECCGNLFQKRAGSKNRFCKPECYNFHSRKVEHPSEDVLREDIQNLSWLAMGRKYGVSDSAVRKWAKSYGIIDPT